MAYFNFQHKLKFYRRSVLLRFLFIKVPPRIRWKLAALLAVALFIAFSGNDLQASRAPHPVSTEDLEASYIRQPMLLINYGEEDEEDVDAFFTEMEKGLKEKTPAEKFSERKAQKGIKTAKPKPLPKEAEKPAEAAAAPSPLVKVETKTETKVETTTVTKTTKPAAKPAKPVKTAAKKTPKKEAPVADPAAEEYGLLNKSIRKTTEPHTFESFTVERGTFPDPFARKEIPAETSPDAGAAGVTPGPDGAASLSVDSPAAAEKLDNIYEDGDNFLEVEVNEDYEYVARIQQDAKDALLAGLNEVAIQYYKEILEVDAKNKSAMLGLAIAYQQNQQYEQSRQFYKNVLKADSRNKVALNNYLILLAQQFPQEAFGEFEKLFKANPKFSILPAQMGIIHLKGEKYKEAAQYLAHALMLSPENLEYKYNLAIAYDKLGHRREAIRLYQEMVHAGRNGYMLPAAVDKIQDRLTFLSTQPEHSVN